MAHRRKRSISFDPVLDERVEAAAAAAGLSVSAWLARCAEDRLIAEDGLLAMVEYEELFGPLSAEELAAADTIIDDGLAAAKAAYDQMRARRSRGAA